MQTNFGIVKYIVTKKLENALLSEGKSNEKQLSIEFFNLIKESSYLQKEFNIFKNIEEAYLTDYVEQFINENLKQIRHYSPNKFLNEHNKLSKFIDENIALVPDDKYALYESIGILIESQIKSNTSTAEYYKAFKNVVEYVKKDKTKKIVESIKIPLDIEINEVLKLSLLKFNEKYKLDEGQKQIVNSLTFGNEKDKKILFESYKNKNIELLESSTKEGYENKIMETIEKLKKMQFNESTYQHDIEKLYELNKNLS